MREGEHIAGNENERRGEEMREMECGISCVCVCVDDYDDDGGDEE